MCREHDIVVYIIITYYVHLKTFTQKNYIGANTISLDINQHLSAPWATYKLHLWRVLQVYSLKIHYSLKNNKLQYILFVLIVGRFKLKIFSENFGKNLIQ